MLYSSKVFVHVLGSTQTFTYVCIVTTSKQKKQYSPSFILWKWSSSERKLNSRRINGSETVLMTGSSTHMYVLEVLEMAYEESDIFACITTLQRTGFFWGSIFT